MKNIKKYIGILILSLLVGSAFTQTPPPPNNGNGTPGGGNTPVGGGAPIEGGLIILLASAGAYAYSKWKNKTPEYTVIK